MQAKLSEDRRAIMLRALADQPGVTLNEGLLEDVLETFGHRVGRDIVRSEAQWLSEQGLVTVDQGLLWVLTLTRRGSDVAHGKAAAPGVKGLGAH